MKRDWILIAVLVLIALGLMLYIGSENSACEKVVVEIGGELYGTYDRRTDCTVLLPHHTLEIQNGTVRITKSDCLGQDCVKTGEISKAHQSILCLPYRLNVTIMGTTTDTITY